MNDRKRYFSEYRFFFTGGWGQESSFFSDPLSLKDFCQTHLLWVDSLYSPSFSWLGEDIWLSLLSSSHTLLHCITCEDDSGREIFPAFILWSELGDSEVEVLALATHSQCQGLGVMKTLWNFWLEHLKKKSIKKILLEVHEGNKSARGFYQGLGFATVGRRQFYYRDRADALVLCLSLQN
jgi:GNAT superfamily N-acetyltransferase